MFGSSVLDIAIGLTFFFLLISLVCSAITEIFESVLKNRATELERGIREIFNQKTGREHVARFYNHPMISSLYRGTYTSKNRAIRFCDYLYPTNLPSYIPAKNFTYALLDILLHTPATENVVRDDAVSSQGATDVINAAVLPASMGAVRSAITREFSSKQLGRALRTLAEQSGDDLNAMRENVETWFNGAMDRVSGNYKRRTQWVIFIVGFILAVLLNANAVTVATRLSKDSTLRSLIVAQAEAFAKRPDALTPDYEKNKQALEDVGFPLGWSTGIDFIDPFRNKNFNTWDHVLLPIIGWLITAYAVSLGAPFWFDLLNKFMVIRSTVKPHEKSLEEGSEDRQSNEARRQPAAGTTTSTSSASGSQTGSALTAIGNIPEPDFEAGPDPVDNESHLDEGDEPTANFTPDEELPPAEGGVG